MYFLGLFLVLMVCQQLSRAFPAPVDTVIVQVQQWGVVGDQGVVAQVLLNGISLHNTSLEVASIVRAMSADALLQALISANRTSPLRDRTILLSRECILEGSELRWTDRLFCDGDVYLTLDRGDLWVAGEPPALALRELWDREVRRTGAQRDDLQECCSRLMGELKLAEKRPHSASQTFLPQLLIVCLSVLILTGLMITSLLLSKRMGLRHPGGVLGSIVHYPKDADEIDPEKKSLGYQTL